MEVLHRVIKVGKEEGRRVDRTVIESRHLRLSSVDWRGEDGNGEDKMSLMGPIRNIFVFSLLQILKTPQNLNYRFEDWARTSGVH